MKKQFRCKLCINVCSLCLLNKSFLHLNYFCTFKNIVHWSILFQFYHSIQCSILPLPYPHTKISSWILPSCICTYPVHGLLQLSWSYIQIDAFVPMNFWHMFWHLKGQRRKDRLNGNRMSIVQKKPMRSINLACFVSRSYHIAPSSLIY